jgi:hypothetical protein
MMMDRRLIMATVVLAGVLIGCEPADSSGGADHAESEVRDSDMQASEAVEAPAGMSCVETYDRETLSNRAFAFDGTVTDIGDHVAQGDPYVEVTFEVHEWFRGDGPAEVGVQMWPPHETTSVETTTYERGARLLVAGEPRWDGEPLDTPIAWSCGFTRTHTDEVADTWRTVLEAAGGQ